MSNTATPEETDTESDVEFEDVPLAAAPRSAPETDNNGASSVHSVSFQTETPLWVPMLSLPEQRAEPLRPGSTEETQLRGRLSTGIERINYRHMKSEMGMDGSETRASEKRFENFAQLAREVGSLVDSLWASATPSIQVEGLITLAGITEMALPTYKFDPEATLTILHKFDSIFAALCTGQHPVTKEPIPGAAADRPLVTQTQKVRIRSLAEMTRYKIFSCLESSGSSSFSELNENGNVVYDDEPLGADTPMQPWLMEAARVYDQTLMLLADQGEGDDLDGGFSAD
ncbi:hypothetical protein N7504_009717 [Penicillium tannophilum]|nr:hypothetical protein N7504_009717 [Penicillium tannophilum]